MTRTQDHGLAGRNPGSLKHPFAILVGGGQIRWVYKGGELVFYKRYGLTGSWYVKRKS
jgi:hypothetical protein